MEDVELKSSRGFTQALGAVLAAAVFVNTAYHVSWILREPDLWWHIRSGQLMLSKWQVPYVDVFSYTHEGQPWIAKEWLSQVIYALSFNLVGWAGPLLLAAMSISAAAYLFYRSAVTNLQPFFAGALALACVFIVQGVTVARPHIFTFPLAVGLTIVLFNAARNKSTPPYWSLAIPFVWANLHGSVPLAFAISACAFVDFLERSRFADRSAIVRWLVYLALSFLVTLVDPYFTKPYEIAFSLAGGLSVMSQISEWAPFTLPGDRIAELGIMLVLFVLLKVRARLTVGQIVFLLLMLNMMFTYVRFIYAFFLLVPIALLPELVEASPKFSWTSWASRRRDRMESFLGTNSVVAFFFAAVVVLGCSGFQMRQDGVVPPEDVSISSALAYVRENRGVEPAFNMEVLNDYNFGGPLILEGIKTYVDGRAEQLFLGEFMEKYLASGSPNGDAELLGIVSNRQIGWTIFPPADPRNLTLANQPDWIKTYADDFAVIYKRRS